jgi:hypothetical protein
MLNALGDTDDGFYPQNVLLAEETRPLRFLVIQQVAENNTDLSIKPLNSRLSFKHVYNLDPRFMKFE